MLAVDPLIPENCEVEPLWIRIDFQHIADAWLDWDWGIWPSQHLEHFVMFLNFCDVAGHIILPLPLENIVDTKGWSWFETMFRQVVHAKVTSTSTQGPKVSQNFAQNITLPWSACLPLLVHPGSISSPCKQHTSTRLSTWCKKVILQTTPLSSTGLWSSSDVYMPFSGVIGSAYGSERALWPVCGYASPHSKLWCLYWPFQQSVVQLHYCGFRPDGLVFASHAHLGHA